MRFVHFFVISFIKEVLNIGPGTSIFYLKRGGQVSPPCWTLQGAAIRMKELREEIGGHYMLSDSEGHLLDYNGYELVWDEDKKIYIRGEKLY